MTSRPQRALAITLVSKTTEPLVEAYLRRAGVSAMSTRSIELPADLIPPPPGAVVFFADDYPVEAVLGALDLLHAQRPEVLAVVVTASSALSAAAAVVIPKPAWGWTILDAIRAQLEPAGTRDFVSRIGRLLSRRP